MQYFVSIVFNLANGIDVEETKRKMNLYRKENQTLILKNRERQVREPLVCILLGACVSGSRFLCGSTV